MQNVFQRNIYAIGHACASGISAFLMSSKHTAPVSVQDIIYLDAEKENSITCITIRLLIRYRFF